MDDSKKLDAYKIIKKLDRAEAVMKDAKDQPEEGQVLSVWNMEYPDLLRKLGEEIADLDAERSRHEDQAKFFLEDKKLSYQGQVDPKTKKYWTANKAESMAMLSPEYQAAREAWREVNKAYAYLRVKSSAGQHFFDAARSRLSWISKDRSNP